MRDIKNKTSLKQKLKAKINLKNKNKTMSINGNELQSWNIDDVNKKIEKTLLSQNAADFYKGGFWIKVDTIMSESIDSRFNMLKEQRDQEIVNLKWGSRDKINEIMSMNDLLVWEKETQCAVANTTLFNQVNNYMESCSVA